MRDAIYCQLRKQLTAHVSLEVRLLVVVNCTVTTEALLLRLAQVEDLLVEPNRRFCVRDLAAGQFVGRLS